MNAPISTVSLWSFLFHSVPAAVVATVVWWWSRSWHQPQGLSLSWRGIALHMARWVVVLSAFVQVIFKVKKPYMITVKGLGGADQRPIRLTPLMPYIGLVVLSLGVCWLYIAVYHQGNCQGYTFFALEEATLFWLLLVLILVQGIRALAPGKISLRRYFRLCVTPSLITLAVTLLLVATAYVSYPLILQAWSRGVTWPTL